MYAIIPLLPLAAYKIYAYVYAGAPLIDGLSVFILALLTTFIFSAYGNHRAKEKTKRIIMARKKLAYDNAFMASYERMSSEMGMPKTQTYYTIKGGRKDV